MIGEISRYRDLCLRWLNGEKGKGDKGNLQENIAIVDLNCQLSLGFIGDNFLRNVVPSPDKIAAALGSFASWFAPLQHLGIFKAGMKL